MRKSDINNEVSEILLTQEDIEQKVKEIAKRIFVDYRGKDLILVSILKGSVVFLVNLMKFLPMHLAIDFIEISSYEDTESSGVVRLISDLREPIKGKDILIVEDVVDTGLTLSYLKRNLLTRKPKSLKICVLLDKPDRRRIKIDLDYVGFYIPDKFVIGYGLDYRERYRNLPYIGVLKPEIFKKSE